MSTLNAIREALASVDSNVFYGLAAGLPKEAPWDYTVFSRETTTAAANRTGYTDDYLVSVVREGYVPEGTLEDVVAAVTAIPGMKLASRPVEYVYDTRPGTSDVAEMMVVHFTKSRKSR